MKNRKVVIVGGVAGGASCAARLRRVDETAEIVVFEKGQFVSFANCGLPYHVGNVIPEEESLVLATPELFLERFRISVKTGHEVLSVNREKKVVVVREAETGREREEAYDYLVLAPGAVPLVPPIPGLDLEGVFTVRTIPDTRVILRWLKETQAKSAVVAGAGFIGLEMAENLRHLGLEVSVVEMGRQILPPMDPEVVRPIERLMEEKGVRLFLGDAVAKVEKTVDGKLAVHAKSGKTLEADLVISALGVRPDVSLARAAGLEIGERGGIRVDEQMRTSDPSIFAVGDAVEVRDIVTGQWMLLALAGPANRQGRVAADALVGREARFRGVQGTAVCGVFGMAAAATGASEKALQRAGITDYEVAYLHPKNHVGYYPGSEVLHIKVLYRKGDGRLLGAQAVGFADAPRKVDVFAALLQMGGTVHDLEEAELCYSPQYGAAKDAVNFAGMLASNSLRGDVKLLKWPEDAAALGGCVLDVRDAEELEEEGFFSGAIHIPLNELRDRLGELPKGETIRVYCRVGVRGYYACRILTQNGFDCENLSGGWLTGRDLLRGG